MNANKKKWFKFFRDKDGLCPHCSAPDNRLHTFSLFQKPLELSTEALKKIITITSPHLSPWFHTLIPQSNDHRMTEINAFNKDLGDIGFFPKNIITTFKKLNIKNPSKVINKTTKIIFNMLKEKWSLNQVEKYSLPNKNKNKDKLEELKTRIKKWKATHSNKRKSQDMPPEPLRKRTRTSDDNIIHELLITPLTLKKRKEPPPLEQDSTHKKQKPSLIEKFLSIDPKTIDFNILANFIDPNSINSNSIKK